MQGLSEADIERHRELAHVGASGAANALGALANTLMLTRVPVVYGPERFCVRSEWTTGIFCDFAGDLSGTVGVFLSDGGVEQVVEALCGRRNASVEYTASVLSELGNILSSQTASAMADRIGGTIVPGLPDLARHQAESVFAARLAPRHAPPRPLYIESELFDRTGGLRALQVVVPDLPKASD